MRPHGKAKVSARSPRAHAICDDCGFRYNHQDLVWKVAWQGPRLQNLKFLVCKTCFDKPQENGLRTFVLPPDPVPITNPRPELYVTPDNPLSTLGFDPLTLRLTTSVGNGVPFGTMTQGAGLAAAIDNQPTKPSWRCARQVPSISGPNIIGFNWNADPSRVANPAVLTLPVQSYSIASVVVQAPTDKSFVGLTSVAVQFQGSNDGAAWFTLWATVSAGTAGETLSSDSSLVMTPYEQHRLVITGDGINPCAVAQLTLNALGPSLAQASVET